MDEALPEQDWAAVYFMRKGRYNDYLDFKNKSLEYQTLINKINTLSNQDDQLKKGKMSIELKNLFKFFHQLKGMLSEICQQLRFLKFQNISELIESFQSIFQNLHNQIVQNHNKAIQNQMRRIQTNEQLKTLCKKCQKNINQINIKKTYDEVTTTNAVEQTQKQILSKEQKLKIIQEFNQYDILIAEKQNYITKVNEILQKKGKIGTMLQTDKNHQFLSEYLQKIEKIQQKRSKTIVNKIKNREKKDQDKKWEEQSYLKILQYLKSVLLEHFIKDCSPPVKKLFQKLNFDNIFKSFNEKENENRFILKEPPQIVKNVQTQTKQLPESQQIKDLYRKLQFKNKEVLVIKANKQEVEKKYFCGLQTIRKIQSDFMSLKNQKKTFQHQIKTIKEQFNKEKNKLLYQIEKLEQEKRQIQDKFFQSKQKLMKSTKYFEKTYINISEQQNIKDKSFNDKSFQELNKQYQIKQTQTEDNIYHSNDSDDQNNLKKAHINRKNSTNNKLSLTFLRKSHRQKNNLTNIIIMQKIKDNQRKLSLISMVSSNNIIPSQKQINQKQAKQIKIQKNEDQIQQQQISQTSQNQIIDINKIIENVTYEPRQSIKKVRLSKFNQLRKTQIEEGKQSYQNNKTFTQGRQPSQKNQQKKKKYYINDNFNQKEKQLESESNYQKVIQNKKQKIYIKRIPRQSMTFRADKQKLKQIASILKPSVYNKYNDTILPQKIPKNDKERLSNIRQKLSFITQNKRPSQLKYQDYINEQKNDQKNVSLNSKRSKVVISSKRYSQKNMIEDDIDKNICDDAITNQPKFNAQHNEETGYHIVQVQNIIETQYAYLKAAGFIDFVLKIGNGDKKKAKTLKIIEQEVKFNYQKPGQNQFILFGGALQAENYMNGRGFWSIHNLKQNMMIYNKNDKLSCKVQKYFGLLKRAKPQIYQSLLNFFLKPISIFQGINSKQNSTNFKSFDESIFLKDLFNKLQKFHKVRHNKCTHIYDFLDKIGFYKYAYF